MLNANGGDSHLERPSSDSDFPPLPFSFGSMPAPFSSLSPGTALGFAPSPSSFMLGPPSQPFGGYLSTPSFPLGVSSFGFPVGPFVSAIPFPVAIAPFPIPGAGVPGSHPLPSHAMPLGGVGAPSAALPYFPFHGAPMAAMPSIAVAPFGVPSSVFGFPSASDFPLSESGSDAPNRTLGSSLANPQPFANRKLGAGSNYTASTLEGDAEYRQCIQSLISSTAPDLALTSANFTSPLIHVHRAVVAPFVHSVRRILASRHPLDSEPITLKVTHDALADILNILYLVSLGPVVSGTTFKPPRPSATAPYVPPSTPLTPSKAHNLVNYSSASKRCKKCGFWGPSTYNGKQECSKCELCSKCSAANPLCAVRQSQPPPHPTPPAQPLAASTPMKPIPDSALSAPDAASEPKMDAPSAPRPIGWAKVVGSIPMHNVRESPSTGAPIVDRIPLGHIVPVYERGSEWMRVGPAKPPYVSKGWSVIEWKGAPRLEFTELKMEPAPTKARVSGTQIGMGIATLVPRSSAPTAEDSSVGFVLSAGSEIEILGKIGESALVRRTSNPSVEAYYPLRDIEVDLQPNAGAFATPTRPLAPSQDQPPQHRLLPTPGPLTMATLLDILHAAEEIECPAVVQLCLASFFAHPFTPQDFVALFHPKNGVPSEPNHFWKNPELLQLVLEQLTLGKIDASLMRESAADLPLAVLSAILTCPQWPFAPVASYKIASKWACSPKNLLACGGDPKRAFAKVQSISRLNELSVLELRDNVQPFGVVNDSQLASLYAAAPQEASRKPCFSIPDRAPLTPPVPLGLPAPVFAAEMIQLLQSGELADVELVFESSPSREIMRCHKSVLSAFSKFFRSFFESRAATATAAAPAFKLEPSLSPAANAATEKEPTTTDQLTLTLSPPTSACPPGDDKTNCMDFETAAVDSRQGPITLTLSERSRQGDADSEMGGGSVRGGGTREFVGDRLLIGGCTMEALVPVIQFMYSNQLLDGVDSGALVQLLELSLQLDVPLLQSTVMARIFQSKDSVTAFLPSLLDALSSGQPSLEAAISPKIIEYLSRPKMMLRSAITRHLPSRVFATCLEAHAASLNPLEIFLIGANWVNARLAVLSEKEGVMTDFERACELFKEISHVVPWSKMPWKTIRDHVVPACKGALMSDRDLCTLFAKSAGTPKTPDIQGNIPDSKKCPGTRVKVLSNKNSHNYQIGSIYVVVSGDADSPTCQAKYPATNWRGNNLKWSDCCLAEECDMWTWRTALDFVEPQDYEEYIKMVVRPGKTVVRVTGGPSEGIIEEITPQNGARVTTHGGSKAMAVPDLKSLAIITL